MSALSEKISEEGERRREVHLEGIEVRQPHIPQHVRAVQTESDTH